MNLLKKGSLGSEVRSWQNFLNSKGYNCGTADGKFGGKTRFATIEFQSAHGLMADGIVGKWTVQKAEELGFVNKTKTYKREVKEIILHITASNDDATVEDIRKLHKGNGWKDIGYHWIVDKAGKVWKGRDEDVIGSHVAGRNVGTLGIAYIARGDDRKPNASYGEFMTPEQKAGLEKLVAEKIKQFGLTIYDVSGHNEYAAKACPCFNVPKSTEFKNNVKALL